MALRSAYLMHVRVLSWLAGPGPSTFWRSAPAAAPAQAPTRAQTPRAAAASAPPPPGSLPPTRQRVSPTRLPRQRSV